MAAPKVNGFTVAYTAVGGIILWSGIKGTSLSTTFKDLLAGQAPSQDEESITGGATLAAPAPSSPTGTTGSSGGTGTVANVPATSAQVMSWIQAANMVLTANGQALSATDIQAVEIIINGESSGNPNAINTTDSNAQAGHPSQGLMQTIPSTFQAYALPGYNTNILDPVSNIIAAVRYARATYGSLENVPGVVAVSEGKQYVGY
jgi:hypothetical protein